MTANLSHACLRDLSLCLEQGPVGLPPPPNLALSTCLSSVYFMRLRVPGSLAPWLHRPPPARLHSFMRHHVDVQRHD